MHENLLYWCLYMYILGSDMRTIGPLVLESLQKIFTSLETQLIAY